MLEEKPFEEGWRTRNGAREGCEKGRGVTGTRTELIGDCICDESNRRSMQGSQRPSTTENRSQQRGQVRHESTLGPEWRL